MNPAAAASPPRTTWGEKLLVALAMALGAVVMTWPLADQLSIAINDYGDPLLNSWILWWDVTSLTTPGLSFFNAPIFHPHPLTLAYSEHMIVSALTAAPLILAGVDAIAAHNLVFLFTFVIAGLGAYLLVWELTGSRAAAWVAALAFAFAPFRFGHLGHLQLQASHFMPLVLLYMHRWQASPRWSLALAFGLFWLLQILSCGYYALFISMAVGLFILYYGLRGRWWRERERLIQLAAVFVLVAMIVAPFFWPYVKVKGEMGFKRTADQAAGYAAEPQHYLAAPPANRLYGRGTAPFRGPEGELFLGVTITGLVLVGLLRPARRRDPEKIRTRTAALGQAVMVAGAVGGGMIWLSGGFDLSLADATLSLHDPVPLWIAAGVGLLVWRVALLGGLGGVRRAGLAALLGLDRGQERPPWSPALGFYLILAVAGFWASLGPRYGLYAILYELVPGFEVLRVPSRLAVLVSLAWAVLAGFGMANLMRAWGRKAWGRALVLIGALGLILLESTSVPVPWLTVYDQTPPVYEWLARLPRGTVIAEVPTLGYQGDFARDARYLYWSTKHHQTLVNGYSGFFPPGYKEMAAKLNHLPEGDGLEELRRRGAQYLVLHLKEYPPGTRKTRLDAYKALPGLDLAWSGVWDYVFRILPAPQRHPMPPAEKAGPRP